LVRRLDCNALTWHEVHFYLLWEQDVGGPNPSAPTNKYKELRFIRSSFFRKIITTHAILSFKIYPIDYASGRETRKIGDEFIGELIRAADRVKMKKNRRPARAHRNMRQEPVPLMFSE